MGNSSGGGGSDQPAADDTEVDLNEGDGDEPYQDGENNPEDSLDQSLDSTDSLGPATVGDNVEIP